ncbi:MAG TPA: BTAD domain-containing putative transcriptional regulator [Solirubrobacteraceae bacterium]|nr:BTAD domain-containing putative transcriptional regulator [Solirubrobacteraceae bacterium]
MVFRVLGPLEVVGGREGRVPAGVKERAILARLLLTPGRAVPGERLIEAAWPESGRAAAVRSLHVRIAGLRGFLEPDRRPGQPPEVLVRDAAGYRLAVEPERVDACRFERLVQEAGAAGPVAALERCDRALALWRGEPYAEFAGVDFVQEEIRRLHDLHAQARRRRAAVLLELGRHTEAMPELERLVGEDPLREDLVADLMLALYRSGRQLEALQAYRALAARLAELGLRPGPGVRAVEARVLEHAPELAAPRPVDRPPPANLATPVSSFAPGRERELELLRAEWAAAMSGGGGVVEVRGEAGIGKTHLVRALAGEVAEAGARVTIGAGLSLTDETPFALWLEPVRELLEPMRARAPWAGDLAPLAPAAASDSLTDTPPELRRARLFAAACALVEAVARERPLLLILEDVHHADASSLELAGHVARRVRDVAALVVLTRREAPPHPRVDVLLDALGRGGVRVARVELGRLADAALRAVVGAGSDLAPETVDAVVQAAGGNPLLAIEAGRAAAAGDGRGPPPTLVGAVRGWLADVDEDARAVLEALAAAERPLRADELVALPVADATGALVRALATGLLDATTERTGYRHDLLRDAVAADIPPPRRRGAHRAVAAAIETCADPRDGGRAAEVAAHLQRAGLRAEAVERLRRAARHARSTGSPAEAAALLRAAVDITDGSGELWLELADAEAWRGRIDDAEAAFACALDHVDPADGRAVAGAWVQRARWAQGTRCAPDIVRDSAARAIRALEASGIDDADLWTGALGLGAWAEAVAGDVGLAERLLDDLGARTASAPRDDLITWETGFARGIAAIRRGAFEDGSTALMAAARAAQRAGRPDLAQASWETAATGAVCAGDGELAVKRLEHALAAARGRGVERSEVRIHGDIARILAGLGRHDAAAARIATAAQVARDLDEPVRAQLDRDCALVALAAGRLDEAERLLASALEGALERGRPGARLAHVEALAGLGRTDEARVALRTATAEPIEPDDLPATLVPRLAAQQAAIAAAEGDHEQARRRLQEADNAWTRLIDASPAGPVAAGIGLDSGIAVVDLVRERDRVRSLLAKGLACR